MSMRRIIAFMAAAVIMLLSALSVYGKSGGETFVYLNGKKIEFDQPPVIENGRTLVPFRAIAEAMGVSVEWNPYEKTLTCYNGERIVSFTVDSTGMRVDGKLICFDVPVKIVNGRTLVPIRAFAEGFGLNVYCKQGTQTININTDTKINGSADELIDMLTADMDYSMKQSYNIKVVFYTLLMNIKELDTEEIEMLKNCYYKYLDSVLNYYKDNIGNDDFDEARNDFFDELMYIATEKSIRPALFEEGGSILETYSYVKELFEKSLITDRELYDDLSYCIDSISAGASHLDYKEISEFENIVADVVDYNFQYLKNSMGIGNEQFKTDEAYDKNRGFLKKLNNFKERNNLEYEYIKLEKCMISENRLAEVIKIIVRNESILSQDKKNEFNDILEEIKEYAGSINIEEYLIIENQEEADEISRWYDEYAEKLRNFAETNGMVIAN